MIYWHDLQTTGYSERTPAWFRPLVRQKKNNKYVYGHMLKKIRVGRSEIYFLFNLIFYNKIDVGWHVECISTLEEGYNI